MKPNGRTRVAALLAATLGASALYGAAPATASPSPTPPVSPSGPQATGAQGSAYAPPDARARSRALGTADRALTARSRELRTGDGDTFGSPTVVFGSRGLQYLTYPRLHRGLPVYGGDVIVATDREGGRVTAVTTGQRAKLDDVATKPVVTAERARAIARDLLGTVTKQSDPRLVVHAAGTKPRLAWESVVTGSSKDGPSVLHVYVDAADGSIADRWDDVRRGVGHPFHNGDPVYIDTSGSAGSYSMTDPTRANLSCASTNGTVYTGADDEWGDGSASGLETACVDGMFAAQRTWDMVRDWLGRDGITGTGRTFPIRVGFNFPNAVWAGDGVWLGHNESGSKQMSSMDVVGHEYGHAIFENTSGGNGSGSETNALNESTGDIIGTLTEHYANQPPGVDAPDYLIGEKVDFSGPGPLRNMYDPAVFGDPGCYSEEVLTQEPHKVAGIQNHWFYLLAEGDRVQGRPEQSPVCAGDGVTGIGLRDAGEIYMGALNLKTVPWTHAKVRAATVQSALALFGCLHLQRVKDAWDAVGVAASPDEPGCPADSRTFTVRTGEPDSVIDQGTSTTVAVRTRKLSGPSQDLDLTAEGVPAGTDVTFTTPRMPSGASTLMRVTTSASTPVGTHTIVVRATSAATPTLSETTSYRLTVSPASPANDFSVSLDRHTVTVKPSQTATLTLGTTTTAGDPQQVALTAFGLPDSFSFTFNPSTITTGQTARVTVHPSEATPPGVYFATVRATGASRRTTTLRLEVPGGDFAVHLTPDAATVEPGQTTASTLETTPVWVAPQALTISASGLPAGVNFAASPTTVELGSPSTLTFTTSAATVPGTYPITVSATGVETRSATFTLTVTPPPLPAWKPYTQYKAGDRVTHNGVVYRCVLGHVSLPGWQPPRTPALWARVKSTK
ncbi:M4 family metallopeptidase [Streptosporangium sp. NPDC020145]|uniref:M4 family metallopeptidase n=1 Tax=Streptosporangium sp. NPDC020145 TaxID=3154694 RepID=UPI0034205829